jgi:hypothetical protein
MKIYFGLIRLKWVQMSGHFVPIWEYKEPKYNSSWFVVKLLFLLPHWSHTKPLLCRRLHHRPVHAHSVQLKEGSGLHTYVQLFPGDAGKF